MAALAENSEPRKWLAGLEHTVSALVESLPERFAALRPLLDERSRRIWAAAEARAMGRGGISRVSESTGLSRTTIRAGLRELAEGPPKATGRVRRPGGGRKPATVKDPQLRAALEQKLDPVVRGFWLSPLRWTCHSSESLATQLRAEGCDVSGRTVNRLLHGLGYRLRGNRKVPRANGRDRNEQFEHINQRVEEFHKYGQPVIWVYIKNQAYTEQNHGGGAFAARPSDATFFGAPESTADTGWKSVELDTGAAGFALEALGRWWREISHKAYPAAERLLVTAEDSAPNKGRSSAWTLLLQGLADELGMQVAVCHVPPGTSKWTRIEDRLFCHARQQRPGEPVVGHEVMAHLIGAVSPPSKSSTRSPSDNREREARRFTASARGSDASNAPDELLGQWNYTIKPRN